MSSSREPRNCAICSGLAHEYLEYKVLGRHDATLFRCETCGFCFIEDPHWLGETFSNSLNYIDVGAVDRCEVVLDFVEELTFSLGIENERIIDWGGGYGLMTRMARDRGLNMWTFDPYVKPLFSHPANLDEMAHSLLICVSEVFLHLENPRQTLSDLLNYSPNVLITAVVPPNEFDQTWWYLTPSTGQHVSFYSTKSLQKLADSLGCSLLTDKKFFHLFTKQEINLRSRIIFRFRILTFGLSYLRRGRRIFGRGIGKSRSLTPSDQKELLTRDEY